ncbi:DUF3325 domain-containing protein [Pseudoalteromonas atlantica]|uniref:DUF3325 domain-containing protein n=1 Tax=Pseudoalteromonas atlantica TaxID=288 RepID=UPI00373552B5
MIELLQFSLCLLAFNCFALAKFNHYRDVFKTRPSQQQSQWFLISAWISILLSLLLCIVEHQGYGGLLFCGYMALSVLLLMIFYSFKATWVKYMSAVNVVLLVISGSYIAIY